VNEDAYHQDSTEVEFITIVEGPAPDFTPTLDDWPWSLPESASSIMCVMCKLRTFDSEALARRCLNAWAESRPVRLDYPDGGGGRREAEILAVRAETTDEGDLLHLWVSL